MAKNLLPMASVHAPTDLQATEVTPSIERISSTLDGLLQDIGENVRRVSSTIPEEHKASYSQYFTPMAIAKQMAAMLYLPPGGHLGDAGAGTGILGAAALALHFDHQEPTGQQTQLSSFEIDERLHAPFLENLERVTGFAVEKGHASPEVDLGTDFLNVAHQLKGLFSDASNTLDAVILNPPYRKLSANSDIASMLKGWGVSVPNLYAAFMVLALEMLKPGGEMVAIVPRSFANGLYFRSFRSWVRRHASIEGVVRYRSRSNLFRQDNVLQENVIIKLRKGAVQNESVRVSVCDTADTTPIFEHMLPAALMLPEDHEGIILMPGCPDDVKALQALQDQPCSLVDLGLSVSTGKIEEHRYRSEICTALDATADAVPMLYAHNWRRGDHAVEWPVIHSRKPELIEVTRRTESRILKKGCYVLLKRISANDDRTGRSHPAILRERDFEGYFGVGLENHVQYVHAKGGGLDSEYLAAGLVTYLKSEMIERALSVISGTTQLNKPDLSALRYPSKMDLEKLGRSACFVLAA